MSESDPVSPASAASSAGSSSSAPTSKAGKGHTATVLWSPAGRGMTRVVAVVIVLWVAAVTIPMNNHFLYGAASGASAMMLVFVALLLAKRRGYDTFFVRELEKREDERDRAASRRACALVGVVGLFGNLVAATVGAFGGPMMPAVAIVIWIQVICLFGGNIYFNRTM
ncbi:hypothetical protein [Actinomyces sp. ZJ308]|uniref:hypothetical protein n=1 Tax=Actinomyces sp. ZJ308 TaxID=2708342 RepID=UPI001FB8A4F7|nr:hypothetical protein [Actinomyces sp. ZJ308]